MKYNPIKQLLLVCFASFLMTGCAPSPQECFESSGFSINSLMGFGKTELQSWLYNKSTVYDYKEKKYRPANTFVEQVQYLEKNNEDLYAKMKDLKVTDDNREMIESAEKAFEFALSKYHSDYIRIADMKDKNLPADAVSNAIDEFDKANHTQFAALQHTAVTAAMAYAKKHNLNVSQVNM